MKHWIGVLCVAVVFVVLGFALRPDDGTTAATRDTFESVSGGLLGLGLLVGAIALLKLASGLIRSGRT